MAKRSITTNQRMIISMIVCMLGILTIIWIAKKFRYPIVNIANAISCKVGGKDWDMFRQYCLTPADDSGKPCERGSECTYKLCLKMSGKEYPSSKGECARYSNQRGCYQTINSKDAFPSTGGREYTNPFVCAD